MTDKPSQIVTRFAPSPTGLLHGGNYRTAVFAYLFARKNGGKFILRIEDTDRERSKPEYKENILEALAWLGLEYDAFSLQSDHLSAHTEALQRLIDAGHAYISREEAKDGSGVMKELVRFKNPNKKVVFEDLIRGRIETDTTDLGDFVIAKNISEPLFHLANVVDDAQAGVTHAIRGEDHIANTPRQIMLYEALGYPVPQFAHLPLVVDASRAKFSKRRGAKPITYYRDQGYLPGAILNFLSLIGWNPGTEQELFSKDELISAFSLDRIQKSSGFFNPEKLDWFNREYLKRLPEGEQLKYIEKFLPDAIKALSGYSKEKLARIRGVLIDHLTHFGELKTMADRGEVAYFFEDPTPPKESLFWKDDKDADHTRAYLDKVVEILQKVEPVDFTAEKLKALIWDYATEVGRGNVLWPMRFALSGRDKSPDPFMLSEILGKETTLRRLASAHTILSQ